MESSGKPINFEHFRAKSTFLLMKVRSSDGELSHVDSVPSENWLCERKAVSDSIGIPGVVKYSSLFNSPSSRYYPSRSGEDDLPKFLNFGFLARAKSRKNDLATRKICTSALDSSTDVSKGHCKLSQAITKESVDLEKESGNKRCRIQSPSPLFVQRNRGLELKDLRSGLSQGNRNFQHVGCSRFTQYKTPSGANAIDVTGPLSEENSTSGSNYIPQVKDHTNQTSSSSENKTKPLGVIGIQARSMDANKQLVALLTAAGAADRKWKGSSTTQKQHPSIQFFSLEPLLPKSVVSKNDYDLVTTNRWITRLMPNPLEEDLYHDRSRKKLRTIHHNSTSCNEVTRHRDEEPVQSNKIDSSPSEDEALSGDDGKDEDPVLSNFWIKRLLRNDLHKKQFPSIAAMAVIGQTMNLYGSCEFQQEGSITIWSTRSS